MEVKYVAITGIMGSGKTTLARNLARQLGWEYLPYYRNAIHYLRDLFSNPGRWAFDAQLSFFTEKALQVKQALSKGHNIILDRSLLEDAEIFAKYFRDNGFIEDRGYLTYSTLTDYFLTELPSPKFYIYCDISVDKIKSRLALRSREEDNLYTREHIEEIYALYKKWINHNFDAKVFLIDSNLVDFRETSIIKEIAHEVELLLLNNGDKPVQKDLFGEDLQISKRVTLEKLKTVNGQQVEVYNNVKPHAKVPRLTSSPYVYIAAPFTIMADDIDNSSKDNLQADIFNSGIPHGKIKTGRYRNTLNAISRHFENLNINSLLPHRDVNEWGKKRLNQFEVFSLCTEHVINCDLFFGLLGQSTGAHYEYGLAKARGKPSILLHCSELNDSFIAEGIPSDNNTLILRCDRLREVQKILYSEYVYSFLRNQNLIHS